MPPRRKAKKCEHCGAYFTSRAPRFCSRPCTDAARAAARRGHVPPPAVDGAVWLELGDGEFTLVDAADAPVLSMHTWHKRKEGKGYVGTNIGGHTVRLHNMLFPGAQEVDHINRNGLDNRRANLREATRAQNTANRGVQKNNTSGAIGVSRHGKRWSAKLAVGGKDKRLGSFDTVEEASAAYDKAVLELRGSFAVSNGAVSKGTH